MINELAEKYVGIRYKPKGKSIKGGMDCVTMLATYYRELGYDGKIPKYEYNGKFTLSNVRLFNQGVERLTKEGRVIWNISNLKLNDLIFFSISGKNRIELAAAYLGERKFLYMPHYGKSSISTMTVYWEMKFQYGVRLIECR